MAAPYGNNIPGNAPAKRVIDMRSLVYGAAGPEQPYPVYQFSGYRTRWEWPDHDPFETSSGQPLGPQDNHPPYRGGSGGRIP